MNVLRSLPKHIFVALALALPLAALGQTNPAVPPAPTPSGSPTISPSPIPTPLPTPLVLAPGAVPQILAVTVNKTVFHSGDTILSTVITSTNVAAVELRVAGRVIRYPRTDFGIWRLVYKMPRLPRQFFRDYSAQIVAMNSAGAITARDVVISLR